ncbi:glutamate ABC transporter substrate-binding protein [Thermocatellispora tengchongensis]
MRDFLPDVSLMSGSGTWSGFEVDLAKAIGKSLGVPEDKITFRATSRRERPALLATGQLDMVISTYSINTADDVSFAGPYYLAHVDLLVKDGSPITTVSGLEGRKLCQPASSVSVGIVQRAVQQVTLVPAQTYTDCMNMLIDGTVDAVPGDDIVLAGFANRETIRFKVIGAKLTDERYAVALKKGDQRGCEAVRAAIAGLYRDGTVSTLLRRHFGNVEFDWEENLPAMEPCGS